jgi:hypothetical protein
MRRFSAEMGRSWPFWGGRLVRQAQKPAIPTPTGHRPTGRPNRPQPSPCSYNDTSSSERGPSFRPSQNLIDRPTGHASLFDCSGSSTPMVVTGVPPEDRGGPVSSFFPSQQPSLQKA